MEQINQVAIMHLGSVVVLGALIASRARDRRTTVEGVSGSWAPLPVLVVAQLAGVVALLWIGRSFLDFGATGRRLLWAYLLPYAVSYAVMAVSARRAGRQGRLWAREEWRLHLTALCLAPVLSVAAAPVFQRALGLDRLTALSAGVAIGCGMLAFTATTVVSLRVMYGRELLKRTALVGSAPTPPLPTPVAQVRP